MIDQRRVRLNLATQPVRNRRFFFLAASLTAALTLSLSVWGGSLFFKYRGRASEIGREVGEMDRQIQSAETKKIEFQSRIDELEKTHRRTVDLLNSLIYRKSFSWTDFLSGLEESLPSSCYIVSLTPTVLGDTKIELRVRFAHPNVDELIRWINNLKSEGFDSINIRSERRGDQGNLLTEMSVIYERAV